MHVYLVGGYVRDLLLTRELGYPESQGDRDWVVVGATPQQMLEKGFKPVGKDFPVFLHPNTHEEYALARTERKIGPGYHGFTFHSSQDVTLEEDLKRRDLTINAMALDGEKLIDPYGGLQDIRAKLLRHVSNAFKEDPVRILRIARFNAKLPDFSVAPTTHEMLCEMVNNGEADSLVAERVFQEMRKALKEIRPSRFFEVLTKCGLWQRFFHHFPIDQQILHELDHSESLCEAEKFALLTHCENDLNALKNFLTLLRPPAEISDLVLLWHRLKNDFTQQNPESVLNLIVNCDAFRRPDRLDKVLHVAQFLYKINTDIWYRALEKIILIDSARIAASCIQKSDIRSAIQNARLQAIKELY